MSQKQWYQIGEGGRRLIFFGLPMVGLALLPCAILPRAEQSIAQAIGNSGLGWFIYGTGAVIIVLGMVLYSHIPKRFVIPLGIAGWIVSFSLLYWYSLFGM